MRAVVSRVAWARVTVEGPDGDEVGPDRLEGLDLLAELLELLHAVGTLAAQVEQDDDVPALVLGQAPGLAVRIRHRDRLGR